MTAQQDRSVLNPTLEIIVEWRGTVMEVAHRGEGQGFTLGDGADFDFAHPAIPADAHFTVAEVRDGRVRMAIPPGIEGWTRFGDEVAPIEVSDGFQVIELDGDGRARVEIGELTVHCGRVQAAPVVAAGPSSLVDRDAASSVGAAAAFHALIFIMAWALPIDAATLSADSFDPNDRFVEILFTPEKPVELFDPMKGRGDSGDGEASAPPADEPPTPNAGGAPAPKADKKVIEKTKKMARAEARAAAEDAMSALNGPMTDIFNDRGPLSERAASAMNGMFGRDDGRGIGMGGFDDGPGRGPGGGPGTTVGLGTDAWGATCKDCDGVRGTYGPGEPRSGTRKPKVPPTVTPKTPIVVGGLTRDQIQRVIRRNRSQYKFCYEKELKGNRDLSGKLTVKFTIGPNGRVIAAGLDGDTVGGGVGACVIKKIRRWQFPTPPGGGIVNVRYPFLFKSSS